MDLFHNTLRIAGVALGNCVHVGGISSFLSRAEDYGCRTELLGAAVSIDDVIRYVSLEKPDILAVSYRLTPTSGQSILEHLMREMRRFPETDVIFGGTEAVEIVARKVGGFREYFSGVDAEHLVELFLDKAVNGSECNVHRSSDLSDPVADLFKRRSVDFIGKPLIRHHYGQPELMQTLEGVEAIAKAKVVDVISLATDQNAQEFFFTPEVMDKKLDGAGGVPVREESDLRKIWQASQQGNFPRLRTYAGTQNLEKWAKLSIKTINQCWGTIPLTWYSELDGRSNRELEQAIVENKALMKFYAQRDLPVEVNEAHHWSLRDASDSIAVVMGYLAALNAKDAGVRQYVAQYMFNTPAYTSQANDLAKMLAMASLIEGLHCSTFDSYREVRAGLTHFAPNLNEAKGQLASATQTMMCFKPHIVHVVAFSEASHAAAAEEVIESVEIVNGVIKNLNKGQLEFENSRQIIKRKEEILNDVRVILSAVETLGLKMDCNAPLTNARVLSRAINSGIIDAPHLVGQTGAAGLIKTAPIAGGCYSINPETRKVWSEEERLESLRL